MWIEALEEWLNEAEYEKAESAYARIETPCSYHMFLNSKLCTLIC